MKFAIVDDEGLSEERYDTIDKAIEDASKTVSDTPDSEVEIVQVVKKVSSELKVSVEDVE